MSVALVQPSKDDEVKSGDRGEQRRIGNDGEGAVEP
jgi:hypothetical protein